MKWFRKSGQTKPICRHKWFLSDFRFGEEFDGVDGIPCDIYTITCENCQTNRDLRKYDYLSFIQVFPVETPGGDANDRN